MALAKDPKALAALKAGSTGGIGQATIIGTGSFPIGSAQPILQTVPLNLSPEPVSRSTATMNSSSPRTPSPLSQSVPPPRPSQSDPVDFGSLQRNTSGKSSSTLSAPGVVSGDVPQAIVKPGKPSMPAGGAASLSSPQAPRLAADRLPVAATATVPAPVPAKKNRLFGTRFKVSSSAKKSNRLSTTVNSPVLAAGSQLSKKKKSQGGMMGKDGLTKTQESLDEVFPWTVVEHMAGQESGWVMLEPVQDGAVGWIKIDKLEEEMARLTEKQQQRQMMMQREP
ncbi:MAG: hypothetical protein J3R72DRAFT_460209 [Linnemannia gamsii]|nr:MAG: hypothetical protein J3R72DRAFT_460209 [Linnemannia gamsii]